jgi:type IV pilus assembly protein PilF
MFKIKFFCNFLRSVIARPRSGRGNPVLSANWIAAPAAQARNHVSWAVTFFLLFCFIITIVTACTHSIECQKTDLSQAADYNVQLGLAYLREGDTPRAKQKLLLSLRQAPKWPVALDAMAYFLEITGDNPNAEKYYKEAIKYAPRSGMALNNYGTFLCRTKRYITAERYLMTAAKQMHYVNTAKAYENAGLCAMKIPNDALAKFYFSEAIKQDPRLPTAQYMLILLNYQHNKV